LRTSAGFERILDGRRVPTAYVLEVSSPGLDRPLTRARDYERFTGRRAKLVVKQPVDGQGFQGPAVRRKTENVLIARAVGATLAQLPLDLITRANLEVEF
jgi:ribosome maturation factor RimP